MVVTLYEIYHHFSVEEYCCRVYSGAIIRDGDRKS